MVNVVRIEGVASGATTAIDISDYVSDEVGRIVTARIIRNTHFHASLVCSAIAGPAWVGSANSLQWAGSATAAVWAGSAIPVVWAGSATVMIAWAGSALSVQWAGSANILHTHSYTNTSLGSVQSTVNSPALMGAGGISILGVGSFAAAGLVPTGSAADIVTAGSATSLIPMGSFAAYTPIGSAAAAGVIPVGSFGAIPGTRITNQWLWNSGLLDLAHTTPGASSVTLSGRRQVHLGSPLYSTDTLQLTVQFFREGGIF